MIQKVNVAEKFRAFNDHWSPKILADLNEFQMKAVKVKGEFVWHHHENEDELFYVVKGHLVIKVPDGEIDLEPGEFVVIPHMVEHLPIADEETEILLLEPKTTVNTGTISNERTVANLERI